MSEIIMARVAGVSFRQNDVKMSEVGHPIKLVPEPDNQFDPKAIKVMNAEFDFPCHLGYIPRDQTEPVHLWIAAGAIASCKIESMGAPQNNRTVIGIQLAIEVDRGAVERYTEGA